jgi:hypothetical protein
VREAQVLALIEIESPAEEVLLVAESGIEARARDPYGARQVGYRCALVTLTPEDLKRDVQRLVRIEFPMAAHNCLVSSL